MIEKIIPWGISLVSLLFAIWSGSKKDTKEDTATIATVVVKLENIDKKLDGITQETKDTKEDVRDLENRIVAIEIKLKEVEKEIENGAKQHG